MTKYQKQERLKKEGVKQGEPYLFAQNVLLRGKSLDMVIKVQNDHRTKHKNSDLTPERAILLILEGK